MNSAQLSDDLITTVLVIYALAFCLQAAGLAVERVKRNTRKSPNMATAAVGARYVPDGGITEVAHDRSGYGVVGRMGTVLLGFGFVLNLSSVILRGMAAGRAPWGNMYEFAIVGAAAIVAAYLAGLRVYPIERIGIWVIGLALVILGCAVTILYTPAADLIPVLNSYWLAIHVAAAIIAGGAFTVAAVASLAQLLRRRHRSDGEADSLEGVSYGLILFAFPVWTFAVIAGAVWAEAAWGRYWGWDPKETWAFITWVFYAAYLHAQSTAGWRGRRAAWFSLLGYAAFIFNFVGVNIWLPGLHSYAGV
ncbi:hypothetical protein ASG90_17140 [Nocardioides sp. Soil797]|nr:hypothetical protein ASG90_17140 [Nocardioides sp. Soil797]